MAANSLPNKNNNWELSNGFQRIDPDNYTSRTSLEDSGKLKVEIAVEIKKIEAQERQRAEQAAIDAIKESKRIEDNKIGNLIKSAFKDYVKTSIADSLPSNLKNIYASAQRAYSNANPVNDNDATKPSNNTSKTSGSISSKDILNGLTNLNQKTDITNNYLKQMNDYLNTSLSYQLRTNMYLEKISKFSGLNGDNDNQKGSLFDSLLDSIGGGSNEKIKGGAKTGKISKLKGFGSKLSGMKGIGALGIASSIFSGVSEYSDSGDLLKAGTVATGSGLGGWGGAAAGAALGTAIFPGIGTVVGGLGGGLLGGYLGDKTSRGLYDFATSKKVEEINQSEDIKKYNNTDKKNDALKIIEANEIQFNTKSIKINGIELSELLGGKSNAGYSSSGSSMNSNINNNSQSQSESNSIPTINGNIASPSNSISGNFNPKSNSIPGQINPNSIPTINGNVASPSNSSQPKGSVTGIGGTDGFIDPLSNSNINPEILKKYEGKRLPVVIRNNNPAALSLMQPGSGKSFAERMPGYVGATARPANEGGFYAKFATPEHGIYANSELLKSYGEKGINTANEIVKKWSTDKSAHPAYAARLAKTLGIGPNDKIDLNDPEIRRKLITAQSEHESGTGKPIYNEETFKRGVNGEFPKSNNNNSVEFSENKVKELTIGKTRDLPITSKLKDILNYSAAQNGLEVVVTSGGQAPIGTSIKRTGSTRHDVGGNRLGAADLILYKRDENGNKRPLSMTNENDRKLMEQFTKDSVRAGATGVGAGMGYMGPSTIHIGGGTPASWGGSDWIERARQSGIKEGAIDLASWKNNQNKQNINHVSNATKLDKMTALETSPNPLSKAVMKNRENRENDALEVERENRKGHKLSNQSINKEIEDKKESKKVIESSKESITKSEKEDGSRDKTDKEPSKVSPSREQLKEYFEDGIRGTD